MKMYQPIVAIYLLLGCNVFAYAQSDAQLSRSAGRLVADNSIDLVREVKQRKPVESPDPGQGSTGDALAALDGQQQPGISNRHDQYFSIYDADVELYSDLDFDGYHHAFNVRFDVDVSYDTATVYAKLYLGREGEPWRQYHTTDLFSIYGNDFTDVYEVTTELIDGYPSGYYHILIEVYSLNHVGMVTSELLDHYYLGKDVMLEDLGRDGDPPVWEVTYSGAGSFSMIWLLLILQVAIAARGALTLTPDNDNNN